MVEDEEEKVVLVVDGEDRESRLARRKLGMPFLPEATATPLLPHSQNPSFQLPSSPRDILLVSFVLLFALLSCVFFCLYCFPLRILAQLVMSSQRYQRVRIPLR